MNLVTTLKDGKRVRLMFDYNKQYSLAYHGKKPKELESVTAKLVHFPLDRNDPLNRQVVIVMGIPAIAEVMRHPEDKENRVVGREYAFLKLLEKVPFQSEDVAILTRLFYSECRVFPRVAVSYGDHDVTILEATS